MSVIQTALPVSDSPLWRIGLYNCKRTDRLQVGNRVAASKTAQRLIRLVREAGFDVVGWGLKKYSKKSEHGYTLTITIGQSAIVLHTYPEWRSATINIETCGQRRYCKGAMRRLKKSAKTFYGAKKHLEVEAPPLPLM